MADNDIIAAYAEMVGNALFEGFPDDGREWGNVVKAAGYSLSAGGKRIRPVLTLLFCEMCGGKAENALDAACAVEYMHTFSLIHDDLPCMDNDDLRRGKPSCHKAYGEATALLAGDMLAILPFERISRTGRISPAAALKCINALAYMSGAYGMIGGQQTDTENTGKELPEGTLIPMYSMKTSALLKAACMCGVYCADIPESPDEERYISAAKEYAEALGIAFQIVDDILDVTSTPEVLGKQTGNDAENDRHTFVRTYGLDEARRKAEEYTRRALDALGCFENSETVKRLTLTLLGRKK